MTKAVALATEDELSERVGQRLLGEVGLSAALCFRKNGFGYLRNSVGKFRDLARRQPVVLLTDLDNARCPPSLLREWLGERGSPEGFVFRVVVRQIEAWLLADAEAMAGLLGVDATRLPDRPETVLDSKRTLLNLAARAAREVREDLLAPKGAVAAQGLSYNARLCEFVGARWSPARAAERAPSLDRARRALMALAERLGSRRR